IFAQVGHFYFGEVGQYYFGANKISNSRHSTAIFSPSSNRATNLSRSSIGRHSRHGICVPPANAGKCHLCLRNKLLLGLNGSSKRWFREYTLESSTRGSPEVAYLIF